MSRRRARRIETDRRGVSETLGYVLVFSLVISTIGAVMIFGFSGLEDRQEVEQVNNAERAFDVLADNFDDMRRYEDPSRATEIRLAGGTLSLGEEVTVAVGQGSGGTLDATEQTNVTLRPLVYESDGGIVVYEVGMVFRSDGETNLPRTRTPFVVTDHTATVPAIVTVAGSGTTGITSDRAVLVSAERNPRTRTTSQRTVDAGGGQLWIEIESPRADGWARQLRADGFDNVIHDGDRVAAQLESETGETPDRVTLAVTPVSVQFR